MTSIRPLTQFAEEEIGEFVETKDDPEKWYVLVGNFCGTYSAHTAEKPEEYDDFEDDLAPEDCDANENVDGFYQLGASGWTEDAFADDCNFVGEFAGDSEKLDTRLMHMLVVHEEMLSDEALDAAEGDYKEEDA